MNDPLPVTHDNLEKPGEKDLEFYLLLIIKYPNLLYKHFTIQYQTKYHPRISTNQNRNSTIDTIVSYSVLSLMFSL